MRKWFSVLVVLVFVSLAGAQQTNWEMFHGDLQNTGDSSVHLRPLTLQLEWKTWIGTSYAHATFRDGVVYIGSQSRKLYAIDGTTGAILWSFSLPNRPDGDYRDVKSAVAFYNDTVIVNSWDKTVFCLNIADGSLKWTFEAPWPLHPAARRGFFINPSPKVLDGILYIGLGSSRFHAIDAETGTGLWSYPMNSVSVGTPALYKGIAFIGAGRGRGYDRTVYAINIQTQQLVWSKELGYGVISSPAVKNDVVYVGSANVMYAFDYLTGAEIWSYTLPVGDYIESSPSVTEDSVYFCGGYWKESPPPGQVYRVDRVTGSLVWATGSSGLPKYYCTRISPIISGDVMLLGKYLPPYYDQFFVLGTNAGGLIWTYDVGYTSPGMPAISDNMLYWPSGDGWLYAFSFEQAVIQVTIDIKPGSDLNTINLGSNGNVPVAIFSTADFDATQVDPLTVTLADAGVKVKGNGTPMSSFEDVNGDGLLDIIVHVATSGLVLTVGDVEAVLEGETFDGVHIRGVDTIRIVPSSE